jgi:hypothetical protein
VERGSNKHSAKLDDQIQQETEALERSGKEARAEEFLEKEDASAQPGDAEGAPSGHRISGSGSSADEYTYKDWGEVGGASHPKPKEGASERAQNQQHEQDGESTT